MNPLLIAHENFNPFGTTEPAPKPLRGPDWNAIGDEQSRIIAAGAELEREAERIIRDRQRQANFEAACEFSRKLYILSPGVSVDERVAVLAERRRGKAPPRLTPAEAAVAVEAAEREAKAATRLVATAGKNAASAAAEAQKLAASADETGRASADLERKLAAEREREEAVVAAGVLDAVDGWARSVADAERRAGAAGKIAAAARTRSEAAAQEAAVRQGEQRQAELDRGLALARVTAAKVRAAISEHAAAVARAVAPLMVDLDRQIVELMAAGELPVEFFGVADAAGATLKAALGG